MKKHTIKKLVVSTLVMMSPLFVNANDLIIKTSTLSVDNTIAKIEHIVTEKKGLGVFAIIDHQAAAQKAGLKMHPEKVILFGNPKLGTKIMQQDPRTGLDLPLRVLVYQDGKGKTKIVYHNPEIWQGGFDLKECKMIPKMVKVLDMITTKAAK